MSTRLPSTWRTAEMGDVIQIENSGVEPKSGDIYRYLGLEHIEQQTGVILDAPETDGAEIRSLKYVFEPHHILYGKLRPNLNKVALPDFEGICSTDILPLAVRTPAIREYVAFYLRSPGFVHLATTRASGTKMPRFGPTQIVKAPVPLPPILVQRRVVEILTKADDIRRKRIEARTVVQGVYHSLFHTLFGDPLSNDRRWPTSKVSEFAPDDRSVICGPFGSLLKRHEYFDSGVPVLGIETVAPYEFTGETKYHVTPQKAAELHAYAVRPGDIIIARAGSVGRACVVPEGWPESILGTNLLKVTVSPDRCDPEYFSYALNWRLADEERVASITAGGVYRFLNTTNLRALELPLPPIRHQREFARRVTALKGMARKLDAAGVGGTLASLTSQAFAGRMTADWERENAEEIVAYQRVHDELPRLVLVGLVNAAQREAAKRTVMLTALMKYAFLFQMRNRARQRLYAFRPYKYGPFASEVYDHLGVLEADGLVRQREGSRGGEREWHVIELTAKGRAYAERLLPEFDPDLVEELADVAREYGPLDHDALLDRVYEEYPRFARKSIRGRGRTKGAGAPKGRRPR